MLVDEEGKLSKGSDVLKGLELVKPVFLSFNAVNVLGCIIICLGWEENYSVYYGMLSSIWPLPDVSSIPFPLIVTTKNVSRH